MKTPKEKVTELAEAGDVEAAQRLYDEYNRRDGLSGHDQQICERVFAKVLTSMAEEPEQVEPAKAKPKQPKKAKRKKT